MSTHKNNGRPAEDLETLHGTAAAFRGSHEALKVIGEHVADPPDSIHAMATKVVAARIMPHQATLAIALGADAKVHVIVQARDASTALLCLHVDPKPITETLFVDSLACVEIALSTAAAIAKKRGRDRSEIRAKLEEFVVSALDDLLPADADAA